MIDVLCVGHAVFDITMTVDHHPETNEKCFARQMVSCGGGPAANASVTAVRLGGSAALAAYLGRDFGGDTHLHELEKAGVLTDYIVRGAFPTPVSSILAKPDGNRTVVNYKNDTPPLPPEDSHIPIDAFRTILFDGREPHLSRSIIARAEEKKIPTVLDAGSLHEGTEELCSRVDFLVASETFAAQYTGRADPAEALEVLDDLAPCVIITLGELGLVWREGEESGSLEAFNVNAVDTTGAGDIFHGCFALGVAQGMDLQDNLCRASAAAALCCTRPGARAGIPTLEELTSFLT